MVQEIVEVFTDMVNCSLFPDAHDSLSKSRKERLGEWVSFDDPLHESSGAWLPQIVRQIRYMYDIDNVTCNAHTCSTCTILVFIARLTCS